MKTEEFWALCLNKFTKKLTKQQFNTWIKPLEFEFNKKNYQIVAPNKFAIEWIKERFLEDLNDLAEGHLDSKKIIFVTSAKKAQKTNNEDLQKNSRITKASTRITGLNKSFQILLQEKQTSLRLLQPNKLQKAQVQPITLDLFMAAWVWEKPI